MWEILLRQSTPGSYQLLDIENIIIRYGAGIIEWTKEELKDMDRKTRKILTIYKCFHPRDDVDRL